MDELRSYLGKMRSLKPISSSRPPPGTELMGRAKLAVTGENGVRGASARVSEPSSSARHRWLAATAMMEVRAWADANATMEAAGWGYPVAAEVVPNVVTAGGGVGTANLTYQSRPEASMG